MSGLEENWQFLTFLLAVIIIGWQIFRSNRDMFLKLATKEDIGRVENRIGNLESRLSSIESRVDILETRLIEYEGKRVENQTQVLEWAQNLQQNMDKLVNEMSEKLKEI